MPAVVIGLAILIIGYAVISDHNTKRKEARGICKTTGGTCTSPTGCTCGDGLDEHTH